MQYYRCYEVDVQKTLVKWIADTVTFLPHNISMPDKISKETALDKIHDLILLLQSHLTHHPLASNHDDTISVLDQLNNVFNNYSKISQENNPKPIKPAPILKYDLVPPRVPKAINN